MAPPPHPLCVYLCSLPLIDLLFVYRFLGPPHPPPHSSTRSDLTLRQHYTGVWVKPSQGFSLPLQ